MINKPLLFKTFLTFICLVFLPGMGYASTKIGEKAPSAVLQTIDGKNIDMADYIGKKTTVIWVSDLSLSADEGVDNFIDAYKQYSGKGVSFFIISTIKPDKTEEFIKAYSIPCPVLIGGTDPVTTALTGESGKSINPIDNFFVIDKEGILRSRLHMPGLTTKMIETAIDKLLN